MASIDESKMYDVENSDLFPFSDIIQKDLLSKIRSEKKVRVLDPEVAPNNVVDDLMHDIVAINSLDPDATNINGYDLKDLYIINELKDLINPGAVRLDASNYGTINLIVKPETKKDYAFSLLKFEEAQTKFRSYFKKDTSSDRTCVADLVKSVSLMDVIDKCAMPTVIEDKVVYRIRYIQNIYLPLPLSMDLSSLCKSYYWNATVPELVDDYFAKLRFN
jgi:hypothetical protein